MRGPLAALLILALGLSPDGSVLITKKGEKFEGPVTRAAGEYVVQTVTGLRKIPEAEVVLVFDNVRDVLQKADDRFREAKRLYEEASQMDEANPVRNQKLTLAIEIAQGSVTTNQALQPHYSGAGYASIPGNIQLMLQFIRLCRGAATSETTVAPGAEKSSSVALIEPSFTFTPPASTSTRTALLTDELGAGLNAAAQDLGNPDVARRIEAVKRLIHPPSPLHLGALLKLLESERDVAVIHALSEGLGLMDSSAVLKSLGWAKKETDGARRAVVMSVLRGAGDRAAFDFLLEWFEESPPATHADRAGFASLFRQYHTLSVPQLKDLLTRNRNPRVQTEAIRQLGLIGDKAAAPMLLKTLPNYTKDSAVSLLKLGKPAIPTLIEGARSHEAETHRICSYFLRKLTGIQQPNLIHFENWWATNRKTIVEDEKTWWEEQAKKGWPVEASAFATYDLPMESIVP